MSPVQRTEDAYDRRTENKGRGLLPVAYSGRPKSQCVVLEATALPGIETKTTRAGRDQILPSAKNVVSALIHAGHQRLRGNKG